MIPIFFIVPVLVVHWMADFILQSDYVAKNKSKSMLVLAQHCLIYGGVMFLVFNWQYALFNALVHYIVDFFTSRLNSYLWNKKDVHNFFLVIGFDQLLQYVCLFTSYFLFIQL